MKRLILAGLILLSCSASFGDTKNTADKLPATLTLAAPHWCPFSCNARLSNGKSGILVEYLSGILARYNVKLTVKIVPWSRAIRGANRGLYDGLVSAVPAEAPDLLFTSTPTTSYANCFFTNQNNPYWKYYDRRSLEDVRLAYLKDYGYEEPIARHIKYSQKRHKLIEVSGDNGVRRMIRLLDAGRVDAFIEERWVAQWEFRQLKGVSQTELRKASCMPGTPFYMALTPRLESATALLKILNKELELENNRKILEALADEYLNTNQP